MDLLPAQLAISILLFLVLFFGIGFILNMLLKTTWIPGAVIYPIVLILLVNKTPIGDFIKKPIQGLIDLGVSFSKLLVVDYMVLLAGLIGSILSGVTIKMLRLKGYRMF